MMSGPERLDMVLNLSLTKMWNLVQDLSVVVQLLLMVCLHEKMKI